jgi:hypothetical protein
MRGRSAPSNRIVARPYPRPCDDEVDSTRRGPMAKRSALRCYPRAILVLALVLGMVPLFFSGRALADAYYPPSCMHTAVLETSWSLLCTCGKNGSAFVRDANYVTGIQREINSPATTSRMLPPALRTESSGRRQRRASWLFRWPTGIATRTALLARIRGTCSMIGWSIGERAGRARCILLGRRSTSIGDSTARWGIGRLSRRAAPSAAGYSSIRRVRIDVLCQEPFRLNHQREGEENA